MIFGPYQRREYGDEAWQAYQDARRHYAAAGGPPPELFIGALKVMLRIGSFHACTRRHRGARRHYQTNCLGPEDACGFR